VALGNEQLKTTVKKLTAEKEGLVRKYYLLYLQAEN
jgi:hypothetical protein